MTTREDCTRDLSVCSKWFLSECRHFAYAGENLDREYSKRCSWLNARVNVNPLQIAITNCIKTWIVNLVKFFFSSRKHERFLLLMTCVKRSRPREDLGREYIYIYIYVNK